MPDEPDDNDVVTADFQLPPDDGGTSDDPPDEPDPNAPDPNAPATRRIVINGVATEVPEEVAQQIEAERQAYEAERTRLHQENERMASKPDEPSEPVQTPDDFDEQFWVNPRQAVQSLLAEERKQIEQDMEEKYRKTEAQKEFWNDFYQKYPELKNDSDIVEMILNKNYNELSQLEVPKAMEELATRASKRIGTQLKNSGGGGRSPNDRTETEPATPGQRQPKPATEDETETGGTTLSAVLKQRRQKRQQAG